jgi:Fic family protein
LISCLSALTVSGYLKQHQVEHYRRLSAVRTHGDWEGWTSFFLEGVAAAASDAERGIIAMSSLVATDQPATTRETSRPQSSTLHSEFMKPGVAKSLTRSAVRPGQFVRRLLTN